MRTVDKVQGVVWMRLRDKELNEGKQFWLDDPYGQDCTATDCIAQLLRITKGLELSSHAVRPGYRQSTADAGADLG